MNILDVCIVNVVSEQELARTVRVVIDTDCWGYKERKTGGFFKSDWEKAKRHKSYPENKIFPESSIEYFEGLSNDEWHTMRYGAKLADFTDEEIVEEFNRRLNHPFHRVVISGQAAIKQR